jgi:uncharacterized protein YjbI with pentapeptide repeats
LSEIGDMDRDEAIKLLKGGEEGIAEWNRRREEDRDIANLRGADLNGANLSVANLSGANLGETNLFGANLSAANFFGANLSAANFFEANLSAANLSGTNLNWANLFRADLSGAKLTGAKLSGAKLNGADLSEADLGWAILHNADISGANLSGAKLGETNLSGANLNGANLFRADLSGAKLSGADLSNVNCDWTIFANFDLSEAKGLDSVKHSGPSTIGIDTLFLSKGKISEAFLRGCGVPEPVIINRFALIGAMEPIQFYSCFISYSHVDEEFAELLHNGLQGKRVRCWYAPHDLPIGAKIRPAIDASIRVYDKLLLVLSEHSVNSQWVEQEVETALRREREQNAAVLFPVRLDDAVFSVNGGWPALVTNTRNIGDFRKWKEHDMFQETFARLLRDLKSVASSGVHPLPPTSPETPR